MFYKKKREVQQEKMIKNKQFKTAILLLTSLIIILTLIGCDRSDPVLVQDKEKNEQITKARLEKEEAEKLKRKGLPEFVLVKETISNTNMMIVIW